MTLTIFIKGILTKLLSVLLTLILGFHQAPVSDIGAPMIRIESDYGCPLSYPLIRHLQTRVTKTKTAVSRADEDESTVIILFHKFLPEHTILHGNNQKLDLFPLINI